MRVVRRGTCGGVRPDPCMGMCSVGRVCSACDAYVFPLGIVSSALATTAYCNTRLFVLTVKYPIVLRCTVKSGPAPLRPGFYIAVRGITEQL